MLISIGVFSRSPAGWLFLQVFYSGLLLRCSLRGRPSPSRLMRLHAAQELPSHTVCAAHWRSQKSHLPCYSSSPPVYLSAVLWRFRTSIPAFAQNVSSRHRSLPTRHSVAIPHVASLSTANYWIACRPFPA